MSANGTSPSQHLLAATGSRRPVLQFIQECAFLLKAKDLTTATACALFHRCANFLRQNALQHRNNNSDYAASESGSSGAASHSTRKSADETTTESSIPDYFLIATSCLLLAGKIEENHLNIRRLVNVSYKTFFKDRELTDIDEFYSMRSSILNTELWILRLVGFNPAFTHPHMFLACFLKAVLEWMPRDLVAKQSLTPVCWSILKDSFLSESLMDVKPEYVAVGVLVLGMQLLKLPVPPHENSGHSYWTKACCVDLSGERLDQIVRSLLDVYEEKSIVID